MGCCSQITNQNKQQKNDIKIARNRPTQLSVKKLANAADNKEGQNRAGVSQINVDAQNGVRQTNINGLMVEARESDLGQIYLEFAEQIPGNNQGAEPAVSYLGSQSKNSSLNGSNHKLGSSNSSSRQAGVGNKKRSNTRLGVACKQTVRAPQCVHGLQDILHKMSTMQPTQDN